MTSQSTALIVRQQEAIEMLSRGYTPEEAATVLGVSTRTMRRYLADEAVVAELRAFHRERLATLLRASLLAAPTALRTLRQVAGDANAPEHARVTAARAILEHSERLFATSDLDERVAAIERDQAGDATSGREPGATDLDALSLGADEQ